MSSANESRYNVTAEDIRRTEWKALVEADPVKRCDAYRGVFAKVANEQKQAGNDLVYRAYALLHAVTSYHTKYGDLVAPYGPMMTFEGGSRSAIPDDLAPADLDALSELLPEIDDPELRARVGDVLWIRRKDFRAAQAAVDAFVASAVRLRDWKLWGSYTERIERAVQISARRGFEEVAGRVLEEIVKTFGEAKEHPESGLLACRLIHVLLRQGDVDAAAFAQEAETLALQFADRKEWGFASDYWYAANLCHLHARNEEQARLCRINAAEARISRGEESVNSAKPEYSYAAHWIGKGFEGLRQAKAPTERIKAVHLRLVEVQKLSLNEMGVVDVNPDEMPGFRDREKDEQKWAVKLVSGQPFDHAVARLAMIARPTDVDELRKTVVEAAGEFIFNKIMGASALDQAGKVAAKAGAAGDGTPEQRAEREKVDMILLAKETHWQIRVVWRIDPARRAIYHEHPICRDDLRFLVIDNPFIPPGHEGIALRGLQSGFHGDWLVAMQLLIPEFEASIRYVLAQHGAVTTTMESDGRQADKDINMLLWMSEMEEVFGAGLSFDLRGILIERFGYNLRNDSAHGHLTENDFYHYRSCLLWWLFLHMTWTGYLSIRPPSQEEPLPPSEGVVDGD